LAVSSRERSPFTPDLPTVAEAGVPGFDVSVWFGVVAPSGTPKTVVVRLNAEINRILKLPEVVELFHKQGVKPLGGTADAFATFLREQTVKWAKVVKESGAKAE
jgi:tripartite-type tricarboxylate transporter receptor subunit TctC